MTYIPQHTHDAIRRYLDYGYQPGSFLTSVLSNDLIGAVGYADEINIQYIPDIVRWLQINVPSYAWGSPEAVRLYCIMKARELSAPETET